MKLSKNISWMIIGLVAAGLVVVAGQAYWLKNKSKFMLSANRVHGFSLLDDSGNIFESKNIPRGQKTLFIFTPDEPPLKHVKPGREFFRQLQSAPVGKKIVTILVTRMHKDAALNLRAGLESTAKIILDPAATVGRMYEFWNMTGIARNWCYAFVDDQLRPYFTVCTGEPAPWKEIAPYLQAEYPAL
jgi:hypothetical protein